MIWCIVSSWYFEVHPGNPSNHIYIWRLLRNLCWWTPYFWPGEITHILWTFVVFIDIPGKWQLRSCPRYHWTCKIPARYTPLWFMLGVSNPWGLPPKSSFLIGYNRIFHEIKHPASWNYWDPPFMEPPFLHKWLKSALRNVPRPSRPILSGTAEDSSALLPLLAMIRQGSRTWTSGKIPWGYPQELDGLSGWIFKENFMDLTK